MMNIDLLNYSMELIDKEDEREKKSKKNRGEWIDDKSNGPLTSTVGWLLGDS